MGHICDDCNHVGNPRNHVTPFFIIEVILWIITTVTGFILSLMIVAHDIEKISDLYMSRKTLVLTLLFLGGPVFQIWHTLQKFCHKCGSPNVNPVGSARENELISESNKAG
ncbi:MAG: hypothetical protein LBI42_06740 [Chitinispirillales bacterium]|jgi:hypothetical protein|nr:hypothetical protein [Chitinispirillales bacterium]